MSFSIPKPRTLGIGKAYRGMLPQEYKIISRLVKLRLAAHQMVHAKENAQRDHYRQHDRHKAPNRGEQILSTGRNHSSRGSHDRRIVWSHFCFRLFQIVLSRPFISPPPAHNEPKRSKSGRSNKTPRNELNKIVKNFIRIEHDIRIR